MKIKLERMDWEKVKTAAQEGLRNALINQQVHESILLLAEQEIEKLPNAKPKLPERD